MEEFENWALSFFCWGGDQDGLRRLLSFGAFYGVNTPKEGGESAGLKDTTGHGLKWGLWQL